MSNSCLRLGGALAIASISLVACVSGDAPSAAYLGAQERNGDVAEPEPPPPWSAFEGTRVADRPVRYISVEEIDRIQSESLAHRTQEARGWLHEFAPSPDLGNDDAIFVLASWTGGEVPQTPGQVGTTKRTRVWRVLRVLRSSAAVEIGDEIQLSTESDGVCSEVEVPVGAPRFLLGRLVGAGAGQPRALVLREDKLGHLALGTPIATAEPGQIASFRWQQGPEMTIDAAVEEIDTWQ